MDCNDLGDGEFEAVYYEGFLENYTGNVAVADADSIGQFVIRISFSKLDSLDSITNLPISHTIESSSLRITDTNNKLLFESNESKKLGISNTLRSYHHLWDVHFEGEPFLGEFLVDLELIFDQERSLTYKGFRMLAISCEELQQCNDNPESCAFGDCRLMRIVQQEPPSDPWKYLNCF